MSGEIKARGISPETASEHSARKKVVSMQVGKAFVYVETQGDITTDDQEIYAVAPSPKQVFETGVDALVECVRVVGERIEEIAAKAMPKEVEIEFSITFDAKAKGALIPIFVTAEHGFQTGLKVKAVWKGAERNSASLASG